MLSFQLKYVSRFEIFAWEYMAFVTSVFQFSHAIRCFCKLQVNEKHGNLNMKWFFAAYR